MPIFSLPSDFGIGTLGRDACDFIDFLAAADVHVWEIMPICHTDSSFSPHNALCARAPGRCGSPGNFSLPKV